MTARLSFIILILLGGTVIAGQALQCPCEVLEEQSGFPVLPGQQIPLSEGSPSIQQYDSAAPLWVRHGFGGIRYEEYADLDAEELCSVAGEFWQFHLSINGQEVQPTKLTIFPLTLEAAEPLESSCLAWIFVWSFEFPASYFPQAVYLFRGEWSRGAFPNEGICPMLLKPDRQEGPLLGSSDITVTILGSRL
ncbi:hypothetical protein ACFLSW_06270 [Candidatus Bipolaricaulota bacterium]